MFLFIKKISLKEIKVLFKVLRHKRRRNCPNTWEWLTLPFDTNVGTRVCNEDQLQQIFMITLWGFFYQMTEQSRICLLAVCHLIRPWLFLFPLSRTNCQRYTFTVRRERIFLLLIVRYLDEKLPEVDVSEDAQGGKAEKKKKGNKWIKC